MNDIQSRNPSPGFEAPYPGSTGMPRWTTGELVDAPTLSWRNILAMIGPGLVMGAAAIGGGEWLAGPAVTAKFGGSLLWIAAVSIVVQVLYNIEISRYTLYTGEPIFNGKFRTLPGPMFWVVVYLMLDWGSVAPYLAVNAAVALQTMLVENFSPETNRNHYLLHKFVSTGVYLGAMLPLFFGGKVYNSLRIVMSFKLITVIGFLLILSVFFSHPSSWGEIVSGFFKIGNVPISSGEDRNGNGVLDPGEDFDSDGRLDVEEPILELDQNGKMTKFEDVDGDGKRDAANVENVFVALFTEGRLPKVDWSLIALIAGLAAIAGNGGLTNAPISNMTRDQGWGMGHHVGAIPSLVGGHGIELSHVGCVFEVNDATLPRWKRWYRHVARDQICVWMMACLIGVGLPSILSVEFMPRGTEASDWKLAAMTSDGVARQVSSPTDGVLAARSEFAWMTGPTIAEFFRYGTLFCGFLVLATSMASAIDGFVRRWVDVFWSAIPQLRKLETRYIRQVYFTVLVIYAILGLTVIWTTEKPAFVFKLATTGYNFAFAFSCWHTMIANSILLPEALRPRWRIRVGMILGGVFFIFLGVMSALQLFGVIK